MGSQLRSEAPPRIPSRCRPSRNPSAIASLKLRQPPSAIVQLKLGLAVLIQLHRHILDSVKDLPAIQHYSHHIHRARLPLELPNARHKVIVGDAAVSWVEEVEQAFHLEAFQLEQCQ